MYTDLFRVLVLTRYRGAGLSAVERWRGEALILLCLEPDSKSLYKPESNPSAILTHSSPTVNRRVTGLEREAYTRAVFNVQLQVGGVRDLVTIGQRAWGISRRRAMKRSRLVCEGESRNRMQKTCSEGGDIYI